MSVSGSIAYWDGGAWHLMGKGLDTNPNSYAVLGDDVYICGDFYSTDERDIAGIARWSETALTWSAVGTGVGPRNNNYVQCNDVITIGNDVIIGGGFKTVDDLEALNAARWDGTTWSPVGYGVYDGANGKLGTVNELGALPDGKIVMGGKFTHAYLNDVDNSRTPMSNITIWDPATSKFLPLGSGLDGIVRAIVVAGNDVYVGGDFKQAGSVKVNGIARWDGSQWHALGSGLGNGIIRGMGYHNGKLYIGGSFGEVGGVYAHRIARWDGANWLGLDARINTADSVYGIAITEDGSVYASGSFFNMGGVHVSHIARWSEADQKWHTLGNGLVDAGGAWAGDVRAMITLPDGRVLVGGDFGYAAGISVSNLAVWAPITKTWADWHGGADGTVFALARNGDLLYIGGAFNIIGGISAPGIATYNLATGQWSSLGTGLDGSVFAIAFAPDGLVYVGGSFTATPNGPALLMALYNPATKIWSGTPLGFDPPSGYGTYVYRPNVSALVADSEGVLIGGWFRMRKLNGQPVVNPIPVGLIYWNRKTGQVNKFGNGPRTGLNNDEGDIQALLALADGSFFVGGHFDKIGSGIAANNIARFTAAGWQQLDTGVRTADEYGPGVYAMQLSGDRLFVGGSFFTAGNVTSRHAAAWNIRTSQWEALGDGIRGADFDSRRGAHAMAVSGNTVFLGGQFWFAGAGQAAAFAAWDMMPNTPLPANLNNKAFLPLVQR
jgi:hypothetical protein